jgi:hypothetical protein
MEKLVLANIPIVLTFAIAAWKPRSINTPTRTTLKSPIAAPDGTTAVPQ